MAKGGKSNDGCAPVGAGIFGVLILISMIPKGVWIFLGVAAGVSALVWLTARGLSAYEKARKEAEQRRLAQQSAAAAAAKQQREEAARRDKQRRIELLGAKNAALVESAQASVKEVVASEAARAGWLGDVDFNADIQSITDGFQKAFALRNVAGELSRLDKPSDDDRRILAEATATAVGLESAAVERVQLIGGCASEARLIDRSLSQERQDAQTAEQRAELHARLSAMLYGIEATPDAAATDSDADAVMARVRAYQEIKSQIQRSRDG